MKNTHKSRISSLNHSSLQNGQIRIYHYSQLQKINQERGLLRQSHHLHVKPKIILLLSLIVYLIKLENYSIPNTFPQGTQLGGCLTKDKMFSESQNPHISHHLHTSNTAPFLHHTFKTTFLKLPHYRRLTSSLPLCLVSHLHQDLTMHMGSH